MFFSLQFRSGHDTLNASARTAIGISDNIILENNDTFLLDFAPGRGNRVERVKGPGDIELKVDTDSLEPAGLPAFIDQAGDKLVTKGTYAKMARGDMVRFLAEENIEEPGELRRDHRLGYVFREGLSTEREYVFERVKTDG